MPSSQAAPCEGEGCSSAGQSRCVTCPVTLCRRAHAALDAVRLTRLGSRAGLTAHLTGLEKSMVIPTSAWAALTDEDIARIRRLGAWFWLATQNLEDFPDAARRMLNMMEWWLCLVMPKDEVDQIARFRALTEEERHLLLSAHKESGKYIEGVVLSDILNALFRSVPPALALALAMTEKHEKAERARIMEDKQCSELEAAYEVARRLERSRAEFTEAEAQSTSRGAI